MTSFKNLKIFAIPAIIFLIFITFVYLQFFNKPSSIEIVYDAPLNSLNPYTYSDFNTSRLNYIYETLVAYDQNLNLSSQLATSFGRLDPTTLELKLKPDVYFHNQAKLTSRVIKDLFTTLQSESNLQEILANIQEIEVIDDLTFRIKLLKSDPLIFNKLALIPIAKFQSFENLNQAPNGTGYYQFQSQEDNKIHLSRNDNYHSSKVSFQNLTLVTIPNFAKRIEYANTHSNVVAVLGVSPEVKILNTQNYDLVNHSDQSSNFILFNYNSSLAKQPNFQELFSKIFKAIDFSVLSSSLAKNTNQFLAKGVLGYNPAIGFELESLKELKSSNLLQQFQNTTVRLAIPQPLDKFQNFLIELFTSLNLQVEITALEFEQYSKSDLANFDLIMFGFKSDFADGESFYQAIVRSDSKLNFSNYSNSRADQIILELANVEEEDQRISKLQELSELIRQPSLGIALFENQNYYALSKDFSLKPRLDGMIDIKFLQAN